MASIHTPEYVLLGDTLQVDLEYSLLLLGETAVPRALFGDVNFKLNAVIGTDPKQTSAKGKGVAVLGHGLIMIHCDMTISHLKRLRLG